MWRGMLNVHCKCSSNHPHKVVCWLQSQFTWTYRHTFISVNELCRLLTCFCFVQWITTSYLKSPAILESPRQCSSQSLLNNLKIPLLPHRRSNLYLYLRQCFIANLLTDLTFSTKLTHCTGKACISRHGKPVCLWCESMQNTASLFSWSISVFYEFVAN